jgi:hypothetical protein
MVGGTVALRATDSEASWRTESTEVVVGRDLSGAFDCFGSEEPAQLGFCKTPPSRQSAVQDGRALSDSSAIIKIMGTAERSGERVGRQQEGLQAAVDTYNDARA